MSLMLLHWQVGSSPLVLPGEPTYALANCSHLSPSLINGFFSFQDKCFTLWQQMCKTFVHLLL